MKNKDLAYIWKAANKRGAADFRLIRNAEEFAKKVHYGEKRDGGEWFITHPWAVAKILLSLDLETEIIAAGLLHDVMERGKTYEELKGKFGSHIADLVNELTIKKDDALSKEENDENYNSWLIERIQQNYQIGYLKIAGRIHNLHTIQHCEEQKKRNKIQETKDTLIPLTEKLEMNYLGLLLKDACLEAEAPKLYHMISERYQEVLEENKRSIKFFYRSLKDAFLGTGKESDEIKRMQEWVELLRPEKRMPYQLYVKLKGRKGENEIKASITKHKIYLYDIDLVIKNGCRSIDCFLMLYEKMLFSEGVLVTDVKKKKRKEEWIISLEDRHENRYQVFLHSHSSYMEYMYGSDLKKNEGLVYNRDNKKTDDRYFTLSKITVRTSKGDEKQIMEGATVLDFAFQIHEEIGLSALYGIQGGNILALETRLNEGDIIEIVNNKKADGELCPCPKIKWFEYVRTKKARRCLVKWFEKEYERL